MAEKLAEILTSHLPVNMAKQSKFKCPNCGRIAKKGLFDICFLCHRKIMFEAMPPELQEFAISEIVPPRFLVAETGLLSDRLKEKIEKLPGDKGLFLWGFTGVGKTYAMCALIRQYIPQGYSINRISYEMLCLRIRDTYKQKSPDTELSVIQPLLDADKLFIEDVGTTKSEGNIESDFSLRTFLVILDFRLEQMLPTFITSNRPIEELTKTFDARIAGRIVQGCEIIKLTGKDRRIQEKL